MGSFTYPKRSRILKRSEFIQLSEKGRKFHNRHFLIIAAHGKTGRSRLGITVTRKVGNAVVRNRIKRLTREFFRLRQKEIRDCWDINVIAKKQAAGLSSEQILTSLEDLFDQLSENSGNHETPTGQHRHFVKPSRRNHPHQVCIQKTRLR